MPSLVAARLHPRIECLYEGTAFGLVGDNSLQNAQPINPMNLNSGILEWLTFLRECRFRRIVDTGQRTEVQMLQLLGNPHIQLLRNILKILYRRLWLGIRRFLTRA